MTPQVYAQIATEPIEEAQVRGAVLDAHNGAVVVFHGIIRNHDDDRSVTDLEYSAHPDAQRFLAQVVAAEQERTGLRLAAVHRIGALTVGDVALVAAAGSAHRREAFEAIEALVERIKAEVPIWKRQHFVEGESEWVGL